MQGKITYLILFSSYAYIFIFLCLVLSGSGLPITDELVLILAGYLYRGKIVYIIPLLIFLSLGVFLGDLISYLLGLLLKDKVFEFPLIKRYATPKRQRRLSAFLRLYGPRSVIMIRFLLVGIRPLGYAFLGAKRFRFSAFLIYESIASVLTVVIFVGLGRGFAQHIDYLFGIVYRLRNFLLTGLVVFVAVYLIERFVIRNVRLRFFTRLGWSFLASGVMILLLFAWDYRNVKSISESQIGSVFSGETDQDPGFLVIGRREPVRDWFRSRSFKVSGRRDSLEISSGDGRILLSRTQYLLNGRPIWSGSGELPSFPDQERLIIRLPSGKDVVAYVITALPVPDRMRVESR